MHLSMQAFSLEKLGMVLDVESQAKYKNMTFSNKQDKQVKHRAVMHYLNQMQTSVASEFQLQM